MLDDMDEWNNHHHKKSGLYEKVIQSTTSCFDAEESILNFVNRYTKETWSSQPTFSRKVGGGNPSQLHFE